MYLPPPNQKNKSKIPDKTPTPVKSQNNGSLTNNPQISFFHWALLM